jgi:SAM-dependent methyltransferase
MPATRDAQHAPAGSVPSVTSRARTEVSVATPALALTGERTVPELPEENYWFRRHEAAYAGVPGWVPRPPTVAIDAGCGEGYGVSALAGVFPGCRAIGIDYDATAMAHAARAYAGPHAAYLRGALTSLPLPDECADLVVSFQVLEHIWTPADCLRELARICRPGGTVVLTTPNRLTFSPGLARRERPANVYHCREYDAGELHEELGRWAPGLEVAALLGVCPGARLRDWEFLHGSIAIAQQRTEPAGWDPALAAAVAAVRADDFEIRPDRIDECLDLVVVARQAG